MVKEVNAEIDKIENQKKAGTYQPSPKKNVEVDLNKNKKVLFEKMTEVPLTEN